MNSFTELSLKPGLLKAIQEMGFEKPSPIQAQAIPQLTVEKPGDFIGLASTGTGKTAAFAIPLLERIHPATRAVQGLVLCPTRELAMQVSEQINLLGKYMGIRSIAIYGGAGYEQQIRGLKQGAHIVVGTPGRVVDHLERKTLRLNSLNTMILDEADKMISMGFKEDLERVLSSFEKGAVPIWLFSATMSAEVRNVSRTYLINPAQVSINRTEVVAKGIEQIFYPSQEAHKPEILCKIIDAAEGFYGLVFCQTKALVHDLTEYLKHRQYPVDCLHGDMDQRARERTMQAFRDHRVTLLICTDVASRGLDVKDITHVINYSIPRELDHYVHRIGRTARSGKTGFAISLVSPSQRGLLRQVERNTKSVIKEGRIPTRKEIVSLKVSAVLPKFLEQKDYTRAIELLSPEWKAALAAMPPQEIAARFLTLSMSDLFNERAKK